MNGEERFGHSLAVVDGDLALDTNASGQLELRTVAGLRNLLQALELRILTPFASDRFNTTYGLDVQQAFTQAGTLRTVKELVRLNLVRTLGTDSRIREVREVVFPDDPAYLARHRELKAEDVRDLRRRRLWPVDVILTTVTGEEQTLSTSVGV